MKIIKKVIIIMLLFTFVFSLTNSNHSLANNMMDYVTEQAKKDSNDAVVTPIETIAKSVITVTRVICAAVAITMLSILAMKYMTSAPSEKADIKKHAVVYVVGATIMFACSGILSLIQKFAAGI